MTTLAHVLAELPGLARADLASFVSRSRVTRLTFFVQA